MKDKFETKLEYKTTFDPYLATKIWLFFATPAILICSIVYLVYYADWVDRIPSWSVLIFIGICAIFAGVRFLKRML